MALTLRERCARRLSGLKAARAPYEAEAKEIASYCQPARSRFLASDTNKNVRQRNARLHSSHGIFAFRTLQGGMTSGLSSQSRPWFTLATYDDALMHEEGVKAYLAEVEKRLYAFLAQTNFYGALKTGYLEMGLFGTEACVMVEHPREGAVCHQLTFGEYWIGLGSALTPDTLYRSMPLTVNQAVQLYGHKVSPRIRQLYDASHLEEVCHFIQAIEPNEDWEEGARGFSGKRFRSVVWDEEDGRNADAHLLSVSGYEEQPFWAPRWDTAGADAWGVGPGHDGLADLRELQLQSKRKAEATDYHVWPEIIVPAKVKLKRQPKAVTSAAVADIERVLVPYEVPYQAIQAIAQDVAKCEERVSQAAYADLFMAITNMQGIQPRNVEEIASRNEEKLTQLGPVIERVNNEKLEVAIDRAFGIVQRARLLPEPPEALNGIGLKINFVSILTQMQRMVGLGQIERTAAFIGSLAGLFPEAADKIDLDAMVDEFADRAGTPPKIIRPTAEANELRAARAEQQQAAQMAQIAAAAAPAAKDLAQAAKLSAELPGGTGEPQ